MKNKLQALITEQKALTARFEELANESNKPYAFVGNDEYSNKIKIFFGGDALFLSDTYFSDETSIYFMTKKGHVGRCDSDECWVESLSLSHTIIDLNEQPYFFKELNNTDPKKVYIKGHPTRGAEVIKMLEDLGGVNKENIKGNLDDNAYIIDSDGTIASLYLKYAISEKYTELHLPGEVSTENTQNTDIKVGDWIWVDEIYDYADDVIDLIKKANPHKIIEGEDVGYLDFEIDGYGYQISIVYDKFHKVEPPKEEVELIEGEVYENEDGCVWIHEHLDVSDSSSISICGLDNKGNLHLQGWFSLGGLKKSDKTELLFDIIKDNNKYFDKENTRLIDVEEWSCEQGLPFIVRHHNKDKWKCVIFWEFYSVKGSAGKPVKLFKSNEYCDYKCAIPYNDQTKKLIGTTDNPEKHYKFVTKES